MDHTTRAVLAQADVDDTTNEITQFQPLLDGVDLTGAVITADALHIQHAHADWLVTVKQAAYVLIVKANQLTLHHQLAALPWRHIPAQDHTRDRGHQRVEIRHLQVATVPGLGFPHATQAIRITRRVRPLTGRKWRTVTAYHGAVLLRVGRDQLLLPEPLASLLQALPAHQPAGTAGRLPTRAAWLFPGRQPDRPIHPGQLRRRLGALGVACRANRTGALLQLATKSPPSSWPTYSASTPTPPNAGSSSPPGTGPATPPTPPATSSLMSTQGP